MIRSSDLIIIHMNRKTRPCPQCEHGELEIEELSRGARCSYCHKLIELDFVFWTGIPALLALVLTLSFANELDYLGYACAILLVFYSAGFEKLVAPVLPLKHYGDSD